MAGWLQIECDWFTAGWLIEMPSQLYRGMFLCRLWTGCVDTSPDHFFLGTLSPATWMGHLRNNTLLVTNIVLFQYLGSLIEASHPA
jgi:hypothetical protein